jgi:hypothetical protein
MQGLKVKKTASGAKTKWLLGDSKYQNVLWMEKLRTLNDAKDRYLTCTVITPPSTTRAAH